MPFITNDNMKIHYQTIGQGEPLLMLHPNGHCINDWYALDYVTLLEKHFRLILIDCRGFGDSDKPHESKYYVPDLIASDAIAVLDHLHIDTAHCFGYSMGGRHALGLMRYHPDRFKTYIIGGAHPYAHNKLLCSYIQLLHSGLPKLIEVFESNFGAFPPLVKDAFLKNDVKALLAVNSSPVFDYAKSLVAYERNVSFIVGEADPILKYVKQAQESKPGARLSVVPGMNHMQLFFSAKIIAGYLLQSL
jgi:pimeloyl-ACP methyl ester carboxylesterase